MKYISIHLFSQLKGKINFFFFLKSTVRQLGSPVKVVIMCCELAHGTSIAYLQWIQTTTSTLFLVWQSY